MSARIGILKNGELTTIYLFGKTDLFKTCTLLKNYKKAVKIEELISYGDLNYLNNTINTCVYFNRDRGEPFEACKPYVEKVNNIDDINTSTSAVDHYFIFCVNKNKWFYCEAFFNEWVEINKVLIKLKKKK